MNSKYKLSKDTRKYLRNTAHSCFGKECHDCPSDKWECIEEMLGTLTNINKDILAAWVAELKEEDK